MAQINATIQSLNPGEVFFLFTLDARSVGGNLMRFVQSTDPNAQPIVFAGNEYTPVDVEFEGLETSGIGALPTPTIRIANTDGLFQSIVNTWGDLLGCPLTRIRTFGRHLDGQSDADPNAYFGPDVFRVERKSKEDKFFLEWELSASIDQEGKMIPGRQVIRDTCLWRYRQWNANTQTWDYTRAQCPYVGSAKFDINDQPVSDGALDVPSRRISCCEKRFGVGSPLPFGGFPGVARVRM